MDDMQALLTTDVAEESSNQGSPTLVLVAFIRKSAKVALPLGVLALIGTIATGAGLQQSNKASVSESIILRGGHSHSSHHGNDRDEANMFAVRNENDLGWLLDNVCYPGNDYQDLWEHFKVDVHKCLDGLNEGELKVLSNSQAFCPEVRHDETGPATQGWCKRDGDLPDQACNYVTVDGLGEIIRQKGVGGAPGLYAVKSKLRYGDPLYFYPSDSRMAIANPPIDPFINVNQMYEDATHKIWAGQCPLAGPDELNQPKPSNVCEWLSFLKKNSVDLLVSLSPNSAEKNDTVKARCTDYIWEKKGMGFNEENGTGCEGLKYSVTQEQKDFPVGDGGSVAHIFVRSVNWGDFEFKQIYFDSWPDAAGAFNSRVPSIAAIEGILEFTAKGKHVAVHCAGGRGRTGTIVLGTIEKWKKKFSTEQIVSDLVNMRARRADMVEHPTQLMLLGKVLGLNSEQCALAEAVS